MFISWMPASDFTYILLESTEAFANLYGMQDTGNCAVEFVNRGFKGVPPTVFLPNWHDIVWSRTNRVFSRVWRALHREIAVVFGPVIVKSFSFRRWAWLGTTLVTRKLHFCFPYCNAQRSPFLSSTRVAPFLNSNRFTGINRNPSKMQIIDVTACQKVHEICIMYNARDGVR